eukprot:6203748-Pleurochrysis_carterae.AAC.1
MQLHGAAPFRGGKGQAGRRQAGERDARDGDDDGDDGDDDDGDDADEEEESAQSTDESEGGDDVGTNGRRGSALRIDCSDESDGHAHSSSNGRNGRTDGNRKEQASRGGMGRESESDGSLSSSDERIEYSTAVDVLDLAEKRLREEKRQAKRAACGTPPRPGRNKRAHGAGGGAGSVECGSANGSASGSQRSSAQRSAQRKRSVLVKDDEEEEVVEADEAQCGSRPRRNARPFRIVDSDDD